VGFTPWTLTKVSSRSYTFWTRPPLRSEKAGSVPVLSLFWGCLTKYETLPTVLIVDGGLQNLSLCSKPGVRAGRIFIVPHLLWRGLGFSGLILGTAAFSCLLRHTRECGESILTRILRSGICYSNNHQEKIFYIMTFSHGHMEKSLWNVGVGHSCNLTRHSLSLLAKNILYTVIYII
jgi:hypothetical protein